MISRSPVVKQPRSRRRRSGPERSSSRRTPLLLALLALALIAAVAAAILLWPEDPGRGGDSPAPSGEAVALLGVGAYDPDGGDGEHDDEAPLATDDDPATYWTTQNYNSELSSFKSGVGVVLDAGEPTAIERIVVATDTPGFAAEIQAGASPEGPFRTVSESKVASGKTTWTLDGAEARYYVVWITELIGSGHVNEVTAR